MNKTADKKINSEKEKLYKLIDSYLDGETNIFFADYRGVTVEKLTKLRHTLRKNGSSVHIVKNRIAKIVLKEKGYQNVDFLTGPTAMIFSKGESTVSVAKDTVQFSTPDDVSFRVKGALIDKEIYTEKQFIEYSKLPTKPELYAKLMGTINGVAGKLARTLQAMVDENKFSN